MLVLLVGVAPGASDPVNTGSSMTCPAVQTPLYVRPPLPDRFARSGFGAASMWPNALIYRVYLFKTKAKWRSPTQVGREANVFAPFVYRLGRHPFTVERAVRFR
jgi:hypothetical protein